MAGLVEQAVLRLGGDSSGAKRAIGDVKANMRSLGRITSSVAKGMVAGMAIATAAIVALGAKAVHSYQQERRSIAQLDAALKTVGTTYKANERQIERNIRRLEKLSAVGDEDLRGTLGQLTAMTGDYGKALELLPVALDLSASRGIDAATSARLLGMAYHGNTSLLTRYGIILDKNMSKQEKMNKLIKMATGGLTPGTLAGGLGAEEPFKKIGNEIGNMFDDLGKQLTELATPFANSLIAAMQAAVDVGIKGFIEMAKNPDVRAEWITAAKSFGEAMIDAAMGIGQPLTDLMSDIAINFGISLVQQIVKGKQTIEDAFILAGMKAIGADTTAIEKKIANPRPSGIPGKIFDMLESTKVKIGPADQDFLRPDLRDNSLANQGGLIGALAKTYNAMSGNLQSSNAFGRMGAAAKQFMAPINREAVTASNRAEAQETLESITGGQGRGLQQQFDAYAKAGRLGDFPAAISRTLNKNLNENQMNALMRGFSARSSLRTEYMARNGTLQSAPV